MSKFMADQNYVDILHPPPVTRNKAFFFWLDCHELCSETLLKIKGKTFDSKVQFGILCSKKRISKVTPYIDCIPKPYTAPQQVIM